MGWREFRRDREFDEFSQKPCLLTVARRRVSANMPSIIDRYLIREIALTLLATALVLLAMVLSHRLAGYFSKAASGLLARDSIFVLVGLQAGYFLVMLVPLAFLLSVMLTLGRLYRDHEMAALAACGYGPLAVYRAVLLLAIPLALVTAGLSLFLVPAIMDYQFEVLAKARKEAEVSMFVPGTFREMLNGRHVVYIGAMDERELRNVFIQTRESNGDLSVTTGDKGHQRIDQDGSRYVVLDPAADMSFSTMATVIGAYPATAIMKYCASSVLRRRWIRRRRGKNGSIGKPYPPRNY